MEIDQVDMSISEFLRNL